MPTLIDLHTHSNCSDGQLAPAALVAAAAARGVAVLALTDHDTTAGLAEAQAACGEAGMTFIAGVEVTSLWRGQEIHVVGLGIDPEQPQFVAHLATIVALRRQRIVAICEKLGRIPRLAGLDVGAGLFDEVPVPTRTHLARALVKAGAARTLQEAFNRFLGRGARGHVPCDWPALEQAVQAIRAAGGHAVLAHAHRYKLSGGALRNLCAEFAACGGAAMEVSLPGLSPNDADRLARLAREHGLAGSVGSDFHDPGLPWRPLGRFDKLPEDVEPLLPRLMSQDNEDNVNRELFRNLEKLRQLRIEHRDLDQVIARLALDIHTDEVQMRRLKKRKLLLRDQISRLESQAIPDLNA